MNQARGSDWPPTDRRPVNAQADTAEYSVPSTRSAVPNIADQFADLLEPLDERQRRGLIAWLAVSHHEGGCPGRDEVADMVAVELGALTENELCERQRQRSHGLP